MIRILSLAAIVPGAIEQRSRLGTVVKGANSHLYTEAGVAAHPPDVRRGIQVMHCTPYRVPVAAGSRTSTLASAAVAALFGSSGEKQGLGSLVHVQCTLDEWIASSPCLKVAHENFPGLRDVCSISQLGTAGVPVVLDALVHGRPEAVCLSSSDIWLAPFVRRIPGIVSYGDAAAAALLRSDPGEGKACVATVEAVVHRSQLPRVQPGAIDSNIQDVRNWLLDNIASTIELLRAQACLDDWTGVLLAGDGFEDGLSRSVGVCTGLRSRNRPGLEEVHLGSASPLIAVAELVRAAAARAEPARGVVWSASLSGHFAAMLVSVDGRAVIHEGDGVLRCVAQEARGNERDDARG